MDLARERGLKVVEDCAQAHGARYRGKMVGTIGDAAAWSFCQDKIMTTGGEGGLVTTNSRDIWSRVWSYKDHGKSWAAVYERSHPTGFRWLHSSFGTNGRMLETQAAIGRLQLKRMEDWNRQRNHNAARLADACRHFRVFRVPAVPSDVVHAYYRFYAFVEPEELRSGWTRDKVIAELTARGIPAYQGTCPEIYLEEAFADPSLRPAARLPIARLLGETGFALLVHPTLSPDEIERTCSALAEVATLAGRP
jgi:dTDP-4-amino-4,6-dideoxygalactose transaminase